MIDTEMNPDSRNRVPGSSANKKRVFGRKLKRKRLFHGKARETPATSTSTITADLSRNTLPSTSSTGTIRSTEQSSTSSSAQAKQSEIPQSRSRQKLKPQYIDSSPIQNRIFDISLLLPGLQEFLACKACGEDVRFDEIDIRGFGSKLSITCTSCNRVAFIDSSRKVGKQNNAYEINKRSVFALRLLGHGHAGLVTLSGAMDFLPPISHSNYDIINQELKSASKSVAEESMRAAMQEDCSSENQEDDHVTVSGDGSWRKRGHSSLQGVSTLIRYANGKVIDVIMKEVLERWKWMGSLKCSKDPSQPME